MDECGVEGLVLVFLSPLGNIFGFARGRNILWYSLGGSVILELRILVLRCSWEERFWYLLFLEVKAKYKIL